MDGRDDSHGPYDQTARIAQATKALWHQEAGWEDLTPPQKETLDLYASKIARILSGNQNFLDHWADLCGYSQLIINRLNKHVG